MRKLVPFLTAGILAITLAGCLPATQNQVSGDKIKSLSDVETSKAKFDEKTAITFDEIREVYADEEIVLDVKGPQKSQVYDWEDFEIPENSPVKDRHYRPVRVFTDLELKSEPFILVNRDFKKKTISISNRDSKEMYALKNEEFDRKPTGRKFYESRTWGLLDRVYVVVYNDLNTGKQLAKPKIITYKIKQRDPKTPDAPRVNYRFTPVGALELSWKPVKGATEYWIVNVGVLLSEVDEKTGRLFDSGQVQIVAKTKETKWNANKEQHTRPWIIHDIRNKVAPDEDALYRKLGHRPSQEEYLSAYSTAREDRSGLAVIAVKGDKLSTVSNRVELRSYEDRVPVGQASYALDKEVPHTDKGLLVYETLDKLPKKVPILMASGRIRFLPVQPFWDKAEKIKDGLKVPVVVLGSGVAGDMLVEKYPDNYKEILQARAEEAKKVPTGTLNDFGFDKADENDFEKIKELKKEAEEAAKAKEREEALNPHQQLFATTALGEHIAKHLLAGEEFVDLRGFSEATNSDYLHAVFNEAVTQTPNAPQISGARFALDGSSLWIQYLQPDKKVRRERAKQSREVLQKAVKDMQLENLEDLEKVRRINHWVINNVEYNYDALEYLRKINESGLPLEDPALESNWTTYGVAIEHSAVCESYAEAFTFMVREAGLESVVVTGGINGDASVGHAWNAVKINGQWRYFDPTWNDVPGQEEVFFNLDVNDPVMTQEHAIGNDYVMPTFIEKYR